eukprot:1299343-Amphidinium_carterae.1
MTSGSRIQPKPSRQSGPLQARVTVQVPECFILENSNTSPKTAIPKAKLDFSFQNFPWKW